MFLLYQIFITPRKSEPGLREESEEGGLKWIIGIGDSFCTVLWEGLRGTQGYINLLPTCPLLSDDLSQFGS